MKTILYIGRYHRPNDPRLCHREMRILAEHEKDARFVFLEVMSELGIRKIDYVARETTYGPVSMTHVTCRMPRIKHNTHSKIVNLLLEKHNEVIARYASSWKPDVVQASDVREIRLALRIARYSKARAIYDSHEDYFRQQTDYGKGKLSARMVGFFYAILELRCIRNFNAVFCTDDYLLNKYKASYYDAREVHLLRNFPYEIFNRRSQFIPKNNLSLVYIGGVNEYRGVKECADYCDRFNKEFRDKKLTLAVYAQDHSILNDLTARGLIQRYDWIDYSELMEVLQRYDIGICLWHPIPKFYRNLPLKNFDYMAAGLPVLTSNFGNLKTYLDMSQAGIGIDPLNYDEFRAAALQLFDAKARESYSQNGRDWVSRYANFPREAKAYVTCMLGD